MTRELRFRVWYPDAKQMHPVSDYNVGECIVYKKNNPGRIEIMQSTGLSDKNGKEIFEGDILSYRTEPVVVEYHTDMFHCRSTKYPNLSPGNYRLATLREVCEIIGNIYENPELIGGVS